MNIYETLYIVHPALEAGRLKDIIVGIEENLKKLGGKLLAVELWGKRKLSYLIDKQKYGTYVLIQYNGEGKCTNNFSVELEHNPNILAYLTTSIESNDIIEKSEDLDVQIAGQTRETEKIGLDKKTEESTIDDTKENDNMEENIVTQDKEKIENEEESTDKNKDLDETNNSKELIQNNKHESLNDADSKAAESKEE